jgi:hypothetical protein
MLLLSGLASAGGCEDTFGGRALTHLLLLLGQQLQGLAPQQRAAFLHSPAGAAVLQVLHEYCQAKVIRYNNMEVMVGGHPAGAESDQDQQQQQGAGNRQSHTLSGLAGVEQLLLPCLLLQHASADVGACGRPGFVSSSSSSSSSTASGSNNDIGAIEEGGSASRNSGAERTE